jgi:hypothetical protein
MYSHHDDEVLGRMYENYDTQIYKLRLPFTTDRSRKHEKYLTLRVLSSSLVDRYTVHCMLGIYGLSEPG